MKSETELDQLNYESTDILKSGIIEKSYQSVSGSNNTVKNICLAEYAARYTTKDIDQNDNQPNQLPENVGFEMLSLLPEKIYIQFVSRQIGLATRSNLNTNGSINTQVRSRNTQ